MSQPSYGTTKRARSSRSLEGFDTVIHLAGAGIGDKRWNAKRKALIESSRTLPTENLVRLFGALEKPPKTFMSGSAVGYYGNRKDEQLTESSSPSEGFLANLAQQWEAAAAPAQDLGIRTVWLRTGIETTPMGGALKPMLLPTLMGAGGPLGGGRQYQSWISPTIIYATYHLMMNSSCEGPPTSPHLSPDATTVRQDAGQGVAASLVCTRAGLRAENHVR